MPSAFTEHERELIGKQLLKQGYRLFSTYGLKKTNVAEIAKAAGISKGAFYIFYDSKEALFMDVIEEAEIRVRRELLAAIDLPGSSPRARLFAVLKKAFGLFESIPILRFFTGSDYDLLFRRIPEQKLQQHIASDRVFFEELIIRCQNAGIPVRAQPGQISGALYPLVLAIIHGDDLLLNNFSGSIDLLLELVAAFCLGEVALQLQDQSAPHPMMQKGT
jgi:AcrR family transcriptional regulator